MNASAGSGRSLAAFLAAALLMAGCSASTSSGALKVPKKGSPFPSVHASPPPPASCKSDVLSILLGNAKAAAHAVRYPINFQNISAVACTLDGFPEVSFFGKSYSIRVGAPATQNHGTPQHVVTIQPEGIATALLSLENATRYPGGCRQTRVGGILVRPPGLTRSVRLPLSVLACANPKYHVLTVNAVVLGQPAVAE